MHVTYETTRQRADRLGLRVDDVRTAAAAGTIPGAIRVGGPRSEWRFPLHPGDHETRRAGELDGSELATTSSPRETRPGPNGPVTLSARVWALLESAYAAAGLDHPGRFPLDLGDHETRRAGELDGFAGQSDEVALDPSMSPGHPGSVLASARRVADVVSAVRTRPARALSDLAYAVAAVATTHVDDRDGRCARCGWSYPCPDRRELTAALTAAADVVTDGTAS